MARQRPTDDEINNVYIDESSQTKHKYLVIGGIILPKTSCDEFIEAFSRSRLPELPAGELKWVKVSKTKLDAYIRAVNVFFDRGSARVMPHFHSLVIDTSKIDDKTYNSGSREIGFNKEIYQLLMKMGRLYKRGVFHVYADRRTTDSDTNELKSIVNRGGSKKGDARDWPFRRIHFRDSKMEPCLQVTDLLIGAIAYYLNRHNELPGASQAKLKLASHVLARANIGTVFRDNAVSGKFTIWHRQLKVRCASQP